MRARRRQRFSTFASSALAAVALVFASGGCRPAPAVGPGDPQPLGWPCVVDADCTAGLECWQPELIGGPWCTRACAVDDDCPLGARCTDVEPDDEGWVRRCVPSCAREIGSRGGCAADMRCERDGVCQPGACRSDADCFGGTCELGSGRCIRGASPGASADGPCAEDSDCRPPAGSCISGECYHLDCDLGGAYACPEGEVCYAYLPGDDTSPYHRCKRACTAGIDAATPTRPGACEPGEICVPPEAALGGPAPSGHCALPLGGSYVAGTPGARIGDPCTSVADCPNPLGYGWCSARGCAISNCAAAALEGTTPCGAGAVCVHDDVAPAGFDAEAAAYLRAGFCARTCSDTDPCPAGLACRASTGLCQ